MKISLSFVSQMPCPILREYSLYKRLDRTFINSFRTHLLHSACKRRSRSSLLLPVPLPRSAFMEEISAR